MPHLSRYVSKLTLEAQGGWGDLTSDGRKVAWRGRDGWGVIPFAAVGALTGLLLQVLDTGTRRRRGGVFDGVVRGTARFGGAVG